MNGAAICCTACSPRKDPLRLSPLLQAPPEQVLEAVRKLGLEGVIGKRMNSVYEPGERSGAWIKLRTNLEQEFVIGGYIPAHADSMRCSSASMRKRPHLRRECEKWLRAANSRRDLPGSQGAANCLPRQVRHSKCFSLTPNRPRHHLGVPLRTFDQRRSLCPRRHGGYRRLGELPPQVVRRQAIPEHREER